MKLLTNESYPHPFEIFNPVLLALERIPSGLFLPLFICSWVQMAPRAQKFYA